MGAGYTSRDYVSAEVKHSDFKYAPKFKMYVPWLRNFTFKNLYLKNITREGERVVEEGKGVGHIWWQKEIWLEVVNTQCNI